MKICPVCGAENTDGDAFCKSCGAALEKAAPAGKSESGKGSAPGGGKNASRRDVFVDPEEQIVASIGSGYLQNFLADRTVKRSVGILTQKRFYYKGRNFSGAGRAMSSSTEEGMVPLESISFTKLVYTRKTGLLILGILMLFLSAYVPMFFYLIDEMDSNLWPWLMAGVVLVAVVFLVQYYTSRQTLFVISFPGGSFGFDARFYTVNEIRDFQRQLHALKDRLGEEEKRNKDKIPFSV